MTKECAHIRRHLYLLFAVLLREPPSGDLLTALAQMAFLPEGDPLGRVLTGLGRAAVAANVRELEHEYHELFVGITGGELMPYGSWYVAGFLHGWPLVRLREDLNQLGIERDPGGCEPEDHIAAICEALALLCGEEDHDQKWFFDRHLASWGEKFFCDLEEARAARFYRTVATLGKCFLSLERRFFSL